MLRSIGIMEKMEVYLRKHKLKGLTLTLVVIAFLLSGNILAQKVIPDTTSLMIGSQMNVTLELETEKGTVVEWPVLGDTLSQFLEIVSKQNPDTVLQEGTNKLLIRQLITITSFDTGFLVIPPVTFKIKRQNGEISELMSEPVVIEVKNVNVDIARDIKDIKPILSAPYTLRDFLPWLLLLAALGMLGTLIWFYIRNRKKNKPLIKLPSKPHKPPHTIALGLLEDLRIEQLWQKGQVKAYYTRLTDILRWYFEKRFGVTAAEMTSDEILFAMKDHLTEVSTLSDLRKLLMLSDLAKFAKGQPLGAENELSMTYAKTIILHTAAAPSINETGTSGAKETEVNLNSTDE